MLIAAGALAVVFLVLLVASYICFRMAFYFSKKDKIQKEEYPIPPGKVYEPYREKMVQWIKEVRAMPHEEFSVSSFDGLTLCAKYYEFSPDAPIELMFHGYRGNSERDLCGAVQRCFELGHSAFVVDQRACGKSEGSVITFGIKESRDCLTWLDLLLSRFGESKKIFLTGISMGAATVMIASGYDLPRNVAGILADCGYTSARDIIKKVMKDRGIDPRLYPLARLGARIFGGFGLESVSPVEALKSCKKPILFFHGEADDFVPCEMSRINFEACSSQNKKLVTVPDAGHGLSYVLQPEMYLTTLKGFFEV